MATNLINATFQEIGIALAPLFDALDSAPRRARLLALIGYAPDTVQASSVIALITNLQSDYTALQALLTTPATNLAGLKNQFNSLLDVLGIVDDLQDLLRQADSTNGTLNLVRDLTVALFGNYLKGAHPTLYALLVILELIEDPGEQAPTPAVFNATDQLVRASYRSYHVHFDRIGTLLNSPQAYFKAAYYPQGLPTRVVANQVVDKLFTRLGIFLSTLGFEVNYGLRDYGLSYGTASDDLQRHMLTVALGGNSTARFGFTLALSSAQDGNLGLVIAPFGTLAYHGNFTNWLVDLILTANIDGLSIGPSGVLLGGASSPLSFGATANIVSQPDNSGSSFQFGAAEGTHISIGEVSFDAGLQVANGHADYGIMAQARHAKFLLKPEGSGGFLKSIIPANGVSGTFDLGMGWSVSKGFYFLGSVGTKARYSISNKGAAKVLAIDAVSVELVADSNGVRLNSTVSGQVTLGPVQVGLDEIGIAALITFPSSHGNLGIANADVAFRFPAGVKVAVESDTISGGGYLFFDPAHHKYAGIAALKLKTATQEINLTALGLLQTELPGNPDAYSLLLLITATFNPIQLGLGFTLNGIGGLLGVNRATDTDYLRGLVRGGHLDQLLFPANVLDNPAAALAIVDAAFPATEGRYVIGLLARLGWGTPTSLITLDVALLIELPSPVRLAILGVLEATLPSKDKDLLKLRADFLGTVDFGSKRAAFDATLSDSHLLAFALTGDLAFRFYQGNNPLFVITAGGFHPAFQPPAGAGLTGLRRLTLALSRGNDLRVTLTSYFAVTSNTVQFGSHLELYYRIARGLHVQGYFGFDVLFQFNPFHVQAHVEAGVAIRYGSRELLSLHLSLDVTGPGPWHIWGSASFKVWFVRIHVNVDTTIGGGSTEPALPATDVKTLLVTALNAPTSWEVEAPKTALPGGVVLRPVGTTAATFFLDPRGALLLRQRVAPLGVQLGKYGRGPITPTTGQRFDLTELVVAGVHHPVATDKDVEVVRDFFAPDQFQQLTDAQKLSLPSFQLLPCGLRLASMAGLVADDKATLRVVEYEHKLLDGTSGGAITSRPPKMSARGYQQLVRGGALGQEIDTACPSARAPQPVNWAEDAFVVVHAATLEVYDSLNHARFATQVEAEQYRQSVVAATPALAGEVLVVPAYQLELA